MVTIFYDSLCPVCNAEIAFLRNRDKRGQVTFIDITESSFDPSRYGRSLDDFIGSIHGIDEDGDLISGMAVFRSTYRAVGIGWLMSWTGWPVVKPLADFGYHAFAKIRPKISRFKGTACESDRCQVKASS
ncbi:thiol-disulfide oxidoreductase DCC family protein [Pseudobacteriovorax antillogorgiicola]|uniref:Predicted thiol-disulfide oxidoreductase YuxK, DCC family n=1 Tax=Pseudobacteriovorax antillogorgiicola TaxID=1513793 RepID=A0A1Y6CIP0_9BACT|nr:DUF393 domain-containing protein [Pseudobacteriovorax antillogorgiicola]TCS47016.1 putative DCC family thiol-disulfide oxidoreductase YuxK [Pseudobacteriovorax antillogorgiicola]SMF65151.1 Predicted thiol-disulfide oxidoreductase YuxK, DCC family [Pseudobacteriovorax antillogorgiicola]